MVYDIYNYNIYDIYNYNLVSGYEIYNRFQRGRLNHQPVTMGQWVKLHQGGYNLVGGLECHHPN